MRIRSGYGCKLKAGGRIPWLRVRIPSDRIKGGASDLCTWLNFEYRAGRRSFTTWAQICTFLHHIVQIFRLGLLSITSIVPSHVLYFLKTGDVVDVVPTMDLVFAVRPALEPSGRGIDSE